MVSGRLVPSGASTVSISDFCPLTCRLIVRPAGVFVSTATPGGGQESTIISALSTLTHHGILYVPLGYKTTFGLLADLTEVRGGSPWGAGTYAVSLDEVNERTSDTIH